MRNWDKKYLLDARQRRGRPTIFSVGGGTSDGVFSGHG